MDATGAITLEFIYGEKVNVPDALILPAGTTRNPSARDKTYRLLHDHLGSVRLVIDGDTGDVAQALEYDAWGVVLTDTNPGFQPFGFAGGLYDPDAKLIRFGARDYDPQEGRWTTKDPKGLAGGLNLYVYVGSDSVNYFDPLGLNRWGDDPSLKQIPNTAERVQNWLDRAIQINPSDPYGYLFDARNVDKLDLYDDNLAAAERYAGAYSGDSLYSDTLLAGDTFLKLARDVCVGGFCGSDLFGKNGSKDGEFVNRWGSLGNFDRERGLPFRGKNRCQ